MTRKNGFIRSLPALLSAASLLVSGCGSGSGSPPTPPNSSADIAEPTQCADCGTLMLGITDADGDFLSYLVSVVSLSLTRADGTTVEALPQSTEIDFAQYTQMTEFVTAASIPNGTYVKANVTLGYSDSEVLVELDDEAVSAQVFDVDGQPMDVATFTLNLADDRPLVIRPGLPSVMVIDFDLAASHTVDLETVPVSVTAEPILVADIDPVETKRMRLRGPLLTVSPDDMSYVVALRPFWLWRGDYGPMRIHTGEDTAFEIDEIAYSGSEGIRALAALQPGTATLAFGTFDVAARRFDAVEVYAGSSVPGQSADVARGVVVARDGDTLTLHGAILIRPQGAIRLGRKIEVEVGPETAVSRAGKPDLAEDYLSVSVGQRITAFGRFDPQQRALNATNGRVRMLPTVIAGVAQVVSDGQVTLDLQGIAGRLPGVFNFAGTGLPGEQADPTAYEVATGDLDLSGIAVFSPLKISGFVSAFGMSPPDFNANTIADFSNAPSTLFINWSPPSATAFLAVGPEGLIVDLENRAIGNRHHINRAGILTSLLTGPGATLLPPIADRGVFVIRQRGALQIYADFARFTEALNDALNGGAQVAVLHATGKWSDQAGVLTARRIAVGLR